jgi:hypothetical protein
MGGAAIPYLLGSEIPNAAVREKTQALGTAWNVIWAFVTNFVIPYMINDIHFKVGWVFGSIAALAFVFTFFFLPETKVCRNIFCTHQASLADRIITCRAVHLKNLMLSFRSGTRHSDQTTCPTPTPNSEWEHWKATGRSMSLLCFIVKPGYI